MEEGQVRERERDFRTENEITLNFKNTVKNSKRILVLSYTVKQVKSKTSSIRQPSKYLNTAIMCPLSLLFGITNFQ